jgi:hypothetical protein
MEGRKEERKKGRKEGRKEEWNMSFSCRMAPQNLVMREPYSWPGRMP